MTLLLKRAFLVVLTAALTGGLAGLVAGYVRTTQSAELKLDMFAQQTESLLAKYRHIPFFLADHPAVVSAMTKEVGSAELDHLLRRTVIATNAFRIVLAREDGSLLAYASRRLSAPAPTVVAENSEITSAGGMVLKRRFTLDRVTGKRLYELAFGIRGAGSAKTGTVAVYVDLEDFEINWRSQSELIFLKLDDGPVIASNTEGLLMEKPQIAENAVFSLPQTYRIGGSADFWLGAGNRSYLTGTRLFVLDQATVLLKYFLIGAVLSGLMGALVFTTFRYLRLRRQLILGRLDEEQAAKERLEQAVQERTHSLRTEMAQRRTAQDRLRRLQAELAEGEKLRTLGEMSAGISHEINQPLFALQALIDSIRHQLDGESDDTSLTDQVDRLARLTERIGDVVRNLRDFTRDSELKLEPVDLSKALRDSLDLLAMRLSIEGVDVDVEAKVAGSFYVAAENIRLQQIIVNLVSNAADAAKTARDPRVIVTIGKEEKEAILAVRDFGSGIGRIDKVFDPFYTTKPAGEGLGLGLSISSRIAGAFGGRITAANRGSGGAEFTLSLPLREPAP